MSDLDLRARDDDGQPWFWVAALIIGFAAMLLFLYLKVGPGAPPRVAPSGLPSASVSPSAGASAAMGASSARKNAKAIVTPAADASGQGAASTADGASPVAASPASGVKP